VRHSWWAHEQWDEVYRHLTGVSLGGAGLLCRSCFVGGARALGMRPLFVVMDIESLSSLLEVSPETTNAP